MPTGEMIKRRPLSDWTPIAIVARIKDPTARELMELALDLDRLSKLQRPPAADPLRIEHNLDYFRMGSAITVRGAVL